MVKKVLLSFIFSAISSTAFADAVTFPRTFLLVGQNIYTGDDHISFAASDPGYSVSLFVLSQSKWIVPYFSTSFNFLTSRQSFYDGGTTTVTSTFNYYAGEANVGLRLYPLAREKSGFNPFVSAGGLVGYNVLQLNQSTTLTSIPRSDQSFSGGYVASVGTEWIVEKDGAYHTSFLLQFEYKYATATLLDRTFNLSHSTLSVGVGW